MSNPLPPLTPAELKSRLDAGEKLRLIDVREPAEFVSELGHIEGAELMPLRTVPSELAKLAGETREIISICKSGMRAGQAAGFWAQNGHKVRVLTGGTMAWRAAGLPTRRD
jgi:rhodanese-related sulfurtransferase